MSKKSRGPSKLWPLVLGFPKQTDTPNKIAHTHTPFSHSPRVKRAWSNLPGQHTTRTTQTATVWMALIKWMPRHGFHCPSPAWRMQSSFEAPNGRRNETLLLPVGGILDFPTQMVQSQTIFLPLKWSSQVAQAQELRE